ncbi:transglutaminase-like superfamily protein [Sarocladium implicatum]|nr:transglutaminase-like superfamily protein [Sarocladium implicatum]
MADVEEPQYNTLAERIAALNKQKNFSSHGTNPDGSKKRAPPPPPPGPAGRSLADGRNQTAPSPAVNSAPVPAVSPSIPPRPTKAAPPPLPRRDTEATPPMRTAPPPLPSRTPSAQASPAMPPRRVSTQSNYLDARRGSASSDVSQLSAVSSLSMGRTASPATTPGTDGGPRKMAPAFGTTTLPKLPPTRRELEAQAVAQELAPTPEASRQRPPIPTAKSSTYGSPTHAPQAQPSVPARPSLPPRVPSRTVKAPLTAPSAHEVPAHLKKPIVGFNNKPAERPAAEPTPEPSPQPRPAIPVRPAPAQHAQPDDAPPPIPVSSRPSHAQIEAAATRAAAPAPEQQIDDCWTCRDWSGPDGVAAQFPRDSLPRHDPVGHLARGLCDPFPSYTDKARAIFTWFHYNIFYDTVAFFGNNVKHMTVEDTIFSGKAVCQGYAETYKAIANRAGLDCVVVSGHGKGFGYTALKKGERPPPPKPSGHAWNAVRIDGGKFSLLDACWGAGHLDTATNTYKQKFTPKQFTMGNDKFGERHFPKDPSHQFRDDGRTLSWDEYYIGRVNGETPIFYTNGHQEGIAEDSVEPMERQISVNSGEIVRFQFSKICPHWTSEKHGEGKPPLLLLSIHGLDGRKDDMIPIETDGYWHWVDVNAKDLGAPGQAVQVAQLTKIDGRDARGVTAREFLQKRGKVGMAWAYVLKWDLVR